jgi:hypothetical protein
MKYIKYTAIAATLLVSNSLVAQSSGENYVKTTSPKIGVTTETQLNGLSEYNTHVTISYVDGIGRATQSINLNGSPNESDIISFKTYDQYGRVTTSYLPYVTDSDGGLLQANPVADQLSFYQNTMRVAHTAYPFAVSTFDNSPLNQVVETSAPGEVWQLGNGHTQKGNIQYNSSSQVHLFNWDGTKALATQYYPENSIVYSESEDVHGSSSRTFVDQSGKMVLTQVQNGTVLDPATGTIQPVFYSTYYVYNERGQLVIVVPPLAYTQMKATGTYDTNTLTGDLLFNYKYDERGRVVEQDAPNQETAYLIHDVLDRPVLSQDANQRIANEWSFTKYDGMGRVILQGTYENLTTTTRAGVQLLVDQHSVLFESDSPIDYNIYQGYTNVAFPTTGMEILIANYYDNYDYDRDGSVDVAFDATAMTPVFIPQRGGPAGPLPVNNQSSMRTRGLRTGSKVKLMDVFNPVMWLTTNTFYDEKMRVIQIDELNMKGGHQITDLFYDFESKVVHSRLKQDINDGNVITIKNKYVYDRSGRLLKL